MTIEEKMKLIDKWEDKCAAYGFAFSVINVDSNNNPPSDALYRRTELQSILSGESFSVFNDPKIYELLKELEKEELDDFNKRRVSLLIKRLEKKLLVSKDFYVEYNKILSTSIMKWLKYKNRSDWKSYAPYLRDLIEANKELNRHRNIEGNLYDALLNDHEEGWNTYRYDEFFDGVKKELKPLLDTIVTSTDVDDSFLHKKYDVDTQRKFMKEILEYIGFNDSWVKISESEHPLTTTLCRNDIRFTTKYIEDDISAAILSTMHEAGHAYFNHQIDEKYDGSVIAKSIGAATHESQSRFSENHIGKSKAFWKVNYPKLQEYFEDELGGVSLEEFYKAITRVKPTLVRMQADEITYPFHIMIRYELEKMIFNDEIDVMDLEDAWNEKYKEYLGIDVPSAKEGILQDMHWPYAYFGYFPTYALGSAFAAQFYHQLEKEKDVEELLLNNKYVEIMDWLKVKVHHYANMKSGDEILKEVTGEWFNSSYYINYLKDKYQNIHVKK